MYIPGTVIYFTPFYFSDGSFKNKYFLVLANTGNDILIASLPTSKNHIPSSMKKEHGCISDDSINFNCYFFEKDRIISDCGTFGFPRDTYIYGEQIDFFDLSILQSTYKNDGRDYIMKCKLLSNEFESIKECLKNSGVVTRKFKKYL